DTVDLTAEAEKAELRALVSAALAGLNPGDREIIELNLRHDLAGRDLADALGVSPNQAHALTSRARSRFETSLGALLVARAGRESCADLAAILAGWDGQLNVLLRKRINRHIERCERCRARKRRELSPTMLLGVLPVALVPTRLRDQVLHIVGHFRPRPLASRGGRDPPPRAFGPVRIPQAPRSAPRGPRAARERRDSRRRGRGRHRDHRRDLVHHVWAQAGRSAFPGAVGHRAV